MTPLTTPLPYCKELGEAIPKPFGVLFDPYEANRAAIKLSPLRYGQLARNYIVMVHNPDAVSIVHRGVAEIVCGTSPSEDIHLLSGDTSIIKKLTGNDSIVRDLAMCSKPNRDRHAVNARRNHRRIHSTITRLDFWEIVGANNYNFMTEHELDNSALRSKERIYEGATKSIRMA